MKINQSEIAKKLKQLKGIVPNKNLPGNQGVLFANNVLMANNLELGLTVAMETRVQDRFIIPPNAIDMIESLPNTEIDISESKGKIVIKSECGTSRFTAMPADKFTEVRAIGEDNQNYEFDTKEIESAINRIMYACSTKTDNELQGVLFEGDGGYLNLVACDGHRLAWEQIKYGNEIKMSIPKESLKKVFAIGLGDKLTVSATKNNAVIKSGEYTAYTRLLDGKFVNYRKMLADNPNVTVINRSDFLESLCRSQICADVKQRTPVVLKGDGHSLNISVKSTLSEFSESIKLAKELPAKIDTAFNGAYLIDMLKSFDEETIGINYTEPLKPMVFVGETMKAVVVPVRRT